MFIFMDFFSCLVDVNLINVDGNKQKFSTHGAWCLYIKTP